MAIGSIPSNSPWRDLQSLATDLAAGNLALAQKDFSSFQQDALNNSQANPNSASASTATTGPSADFQALQNDLNSGNLSAAQQDFANLQRDVQNNGMKGQHHHHHHFFGGDSQSSQSLPNAIATAGSTANSTAGTPNMLSPNTVASMLAAYRAFSASGTTPTSTASLVG